VLSSVTAKPGAGSSGQFHNAIPGQHGNLARRKDSCMERQRSKFPTTITCCQEIFEKIEASAGAFSGARPSPSANVFAVAMHFSAAVGVLCSASIALPQALPRSVRHEYLIATRLACNVSAWFCYAVYPSRRLVRMNHKLRQVRPWLTISLSSLRQAQHVSPSGIPARIRDSWVCLLRDCSDRFSLSIIARSRHGTGTVQQPMRGYVWRTFTPLHSQSTTLKLSHDAPASLRCQYSPSRSGMVCLLTVSFAKRACALTGDLLRHISAKV
jgi:hypothetical protein